MNILTKKVSLSGGIVAAVLAVTIGCSKGSSVDTSSMEKDYLEAWISVNHPGVTSSGRGIYILEDVPGTGEALGKDDFYVFLDYTETDLDGNVASTSSKKLSQQIGTYSPSNYYGDNILILDESYTQLGVLDLIEGMRVGGKRIGVVPGWLNVALADYNKNTSGSNSIFTITLKDKTSDIKAWEADTLAKYVAIHMPGTDSTMFGYYCKTLKEPASGATFPSDTTFYINYTGRLLNGQVFDTTIEDTAKVYGLYSSGRSYAPMVIKLPGDDDYTKITLSTSETSEGSTLVDGFAYCLSKLRPFEKVVCAFYSELGYGYSGSGSSIPKFSPIVFEIEVVEKPSEDD
jgi:FKBP-type peptidyl-prolyl cis-trans isomerase 2